LGLAVLATLAASRTSELVGAGDAPLAALNGGFAVGFAGAAVISLLAAIVGLLAPGRTPTKDAGPAAPTPPAALASPAAPPAPERGDGHEPDRTSLRADRKNPR
jgi:hypothetical protein